jgi:hypothetical protein
VYFSDVDMAVYAAKAIQETMEDDRSPETIGVSIRIGMQYGSAILESDDIFGDTVNVAARVASMAKARQILCTQEIAFMVNNPELSNNMRPYDRLRVKGRNEHLDVYLFGWEQEGDITAMATASSFTNPARYEQAKKLTLFRATIRRSNIVAANSSLPIRAPMGRLSVPRRGRISSCVARNSPCSVPATSVSVRKSISMTKM